MKNPHFHRFCFLWRRNLGLRNGMVTALLTLVTAKQSRQSCGSHYRTDCLSTCTEPAGGVFCALYLRVGLSGDPVGCGEAPFGPGYAHLGQSGWTRQSGKGKLRSGKHLGAMPVHPMAGGVLGGGKPKGRS